MNSCLLQDCYSYKTISRNQFSNLKLNLFMFSIPFFTKDKLLIVFNFSFSFN